MIVGKARLTLVLISVSAILLWASGALADTIITFKESGAPSSGTQLEGNAFYDSFGVTFESSGLFGPDDRLPDDKWGITNFPDVIGAVNFTVPTSFVTFTWATAFDNDFYATAFDTGGNPLDTFEFFNNTTGSQSGSATLAGGLIARLEYSGCQTCEVAIDTLRFPSLPEPSAALLYGIGLLIVGSHLRRRDQALGRFRG